MQFLKKIQNLDRCFLRQCRVMRYHIFFVKDNGKFLTSVCLDIEEFVWLCGDIRFIFRLSTDDLSDFRGVRRRGVRELRAEKARATGAEPGEYFFIIVLTLTLAVEVLRRLITWNDP